MAVNATQTINFYVCVDIRMFADMIFTIRQLVEKLIEHHFKQFLIFVDLTKAHDTVPCEALWYALQKLGVPKTITDIIQSLHEGIKAFSPGPP